MEEQIKVEEKAEDKKVEFDDPYLMTPEQLDEADRKLEVVEEPENQDETPIESDKSIPPDDPDNPKPAEPKEEPKPTDAKVILTQEMLDGMGLSEDAVKLINSKGLVGKPISEFVNQYVNAQKLVGKKAEEIHRELFPLDPKPVTVNAPIIFPLNQKKEETEAQINNLVLDRVKKDSKDIGISADFEYPPTLDIKSPEYKEWYKNTNYDFPVDLKLFESALSKERTDLIKAHNYVIELRDTYKKVNDDKIDNEISKIGEYFGKADIDLKSHGVEFNDKFLSELIFVDKDGKKELDPNMFDWVNGEIPILKEGALAQKFMNTKGSEVLKKIKETALIQGRKEGAEALKNPKPTNKGLGATQTSGEISPTKLGTNKDPNSLSDAELDAEIRRVDALLTKEN